MPYRYEHVKCTQVIDATTIEVSIDCGFGIQKNARIGLYGIVSSSPKRTEYGFTNTPDTKFTAGLLLGRDILLRTYKELREKGGEYCTEYSGVVFVHRAGEWVNANATITLAGHADTSAGWGDVRWMNSLWSSLTRSGHHSTL